MFPSLKSGEKLYTIKIYKGRHEIIQYVPEKSDRVKVFPRKGINVQVTLRLYLTNMFFSSVLINVRFSPVTYHQS